jgi:hypothetical protein
MGLAFLAGGCAASGALTERGGAGVEMAQPAKPPSVVAGEARVVAARVNPRVRVRLTAEAETVAVLFAHSGTTGGQVRLDRASLSPVGDEESSRAGAPQAPRTGPVRVVMEGGRFVECFRRGNSETGYSLMAQAWSAGGSRLGPPVQISPADADVYSSPEVVAIDDRRAVATFVAVANGAFELLAVPLDVL